MKLVIWLICGWALCGSAAIWAIVATRELMWGSLPCWFSLTWDAFLLFVAFALPVKVVILVNALAAEALATQLPTAPQEKP